MKANFRTVHGRYVTVTRGKEWLADRVEPAAWEVITIVFKGEPFAEENRGTRVALLAWNQNYVGVDMGTHKGRMYAGRPIAGPAEAFILYELGGSKYALKSVLADRYVTFEPEARNFQSIADRTQIGAWETFDAIRLP